jgi:hypothetical protein
MDRYSRSPSGNSDRRSGATAGRAVFKNVQLLKGILVDDLLRTMGIMAAALQFDRSDCHTGAGTDKVDWAADTPRKQWSNLDA